MLNFQGGTSDFLGLAEICLQLVSTSLNSKAQGDLNDGHIHPPPRADGAAAGYSQFKTGLTEPSKKTLDRLS